MATRLKSLAIRLALPIAMVGTTAIGAVSPAYAAARAPVVELPKVKISVPDKVVTTASGTKSVPFEVVNGGDTTAVGLVVDFASATAGTPIDPKLGFKPPAECTAAGCTVGDLAPGASKSYSFTVQPAKDLPEAGAKLVLSVRNADAKWQDSATVTVTRTPDKGIDLEAAGIPDITLAAGKSAALPISIRNNGDTPTQGVAVALAAPRYVNFPNNYSNCVDVKDLPGMVCVFDLKLDPGAVFTIERATPLTVAVDRAAPGPADYTAGMYAFGLDDKVNAASLAAATEKAKKPGTKLRLVPAAPSLAPAQRAAAGEAGELNEWDNSTSFLVKVPLNLADSAALGDDFEGKIGAISTVKVGLRNNGPGTVLPRTPKWIHSVKVRMPSGLRLTKVDKRCVPNGDGDPSWNMPGRISGHDYLCVASKPLAPAAQELFSFTGKILDGKNEDEGKITVVGGVQDQHAANDVAEINVKVTTPIAIATPTPIAISGGGAGGGLPITGASTGRIAGTGVLFVLTGALALFLTRRRRPV